MKANISILFAIKVISMIFFSAYFLVRVARWNLHTYSSLITLVCVRTTKCTKATKENAATFFFSLRPISRQPPTHRPCDNLSDRNIFRLPFFLWFSLLPTRGEAIKIEMCIIELTILCQFNIYFVLSVNSAVCKLEDYWKRTERAIRVFTFTGFRRQSGMIIFYRCGCVRAWEFRDRTHTCMYVRFAFDVFDQYILVCVTRYARLTLAGFSVVHVLRRIYPESYLCYAVCYTLMTVYVHIFVLSSDTASVAQYIYTASSKVAQCELAFAKSLRSTNTCILAVISFETA